MLRFYTSTEAAASHLLPNSPPLTMTGAPSPNHGFYIISPLKVFVAAYYLLVNDEHLLDGRLYC